MRKKQIENPTIDCGCGCGGTRLKYDNCGRERKYINGHYIKLNNPMNNFEYIDFNKKNNNPNNLISLCRNCHTQTQMNREDWTQYFQGKIQQIGLNPGGEIK